LGAFSKRAQFPFRAWLPIAIAAPTPISALVHSSTLVTAGVYLIIRFNWIIKNNRGVLILLLLLSLFTIFMSGLIALREIDIKKIIALSTLSQLGLIIFVVFVGNELISFFHLITHALFKAILFLCSGVLIHEFGGNQDIRSYKICVKINFLVVSVFFLFVVCLL